MVNTKRACLTVVSVLIISSVLEPPAYGQTARVALDTYEEGSLWQIMTFRTDAGKTELQIRNIAAVWEQQLKLAEEKAVLLDYEVLTKWSSNPEDWAEFHAETVDTPAFEARFGRLEPTGTQFLGTVFAREVFLKPQ